MPPLMDNVVIDTVILIQLIAYELSGLQAAGAAWGRQLRLCTL